MIFCEVKLCMYNEDYNCKCDAIEINPSGVCHQCMPVSMDEISKETLELIKKEHLKKENELWTKRMHPEITDYDNPKKA